ncbi:hypothetical protein ARMGADRAFT_287401 [Armillaria gallica]|uniref:Uncharacterized protein n=1 Tax=Armillaria gallica TaxID=47427 RepID=A0A2H3D7A1_ARMGA|nr:hypothetical protein ARMGADRAFT_287401 [Armillaria gallica]
MKHESMDGWNGGRREGWMRAVKMLTKPWLLLLRHHGDLYLSIMATQITTGTSEHQDVAKMAFISISALHGLGFDNRLEPKG